MTWRTNPVSFKSILTKLFGRNAHPAHLPYIIKPPAQQHSPTLPNQNMHTSNTNASYTESEADIHSIAGISIAFGKEDIVQADENNNARHFSQTQSHIVG